MKKFFKLKEVFTLKRILAVGAVIAILAMIAVTEHIKKSRNNAARDLLQQIVIAEIVIGMECMNCRGITEGYVFTDGVRETAEEAVARLDKYGYSFRPDPSVAFHIMPPAAVGGVTPKGFIVFAAHNSVGSTVYVYDSIRFRGNDIAQSITEARENDVYSGITITDSAIALFRYNYDPSNTAGPVEKKLGQTKIAPAPSDKAPARMVVTVTAK